MKFNRSTRLWLVLTKVLAAVSVLVPLIIALGELYWSLAYSPLNSTATDFTRMMRQIVFVALLLWSFPQLLFLLCILRNDRWAYLTESAVCLAQAFILAMLTVNAPQFHWQSMALAALFSMTAVLLFSVQNNLPQIPRWVEPTNSQLIAPLPAENIDEPPPTHVG